MFGMLKFLELNRSLDGRATGSRWYRLPDQGGLSVRLMPERRLPQEPVRDAITIRRFGAMAFARQAAARFLS